MILEQTRIGLGIGAGTYTVSDSDKQTMGRYLAFPEPR